MQNLLESKDLLTHLCGLMDKLDNGEITVDVAKEQANLVKQANNVLRYRLDVEKFKANQSQLKGHYE